MKKQICITEQFIRETIYYQVATLLDEMDYLAVFPLFNEWYIKLGENNETDSECIWEIPILLYNGETYIECFTPFEFCETYAELAKGDIDCIAETTEKILAKIYEYEQ